ncbi:MAG: Gldg family protein, partial [Candidatus Cloacimonetes bacterium]|nr:Gldg family protein [Candidatus Cloacimonadota bacterium]
TKSNDQVPLQLKSYGDRVKEFLQEYVDASHGKVELEVFDPRPDTVDEEWAVKYGLQAVPLPSGENFYMGAVFLSGSQEQAMPIFNPQRESFLEYDITQKVAQLRSGSKTKVGVLSSLEIFGNNMPFRMPNQPPPTQDWVVLSELRKTHEVVQIPADTKAIPEVDILWVVHPKNLSEATEYAIDQFVMKGGRLVVMVDPSSKADASGGMFGSGPQPSNLPKLFAKWGIAYDATQIAADFKNSTPVRSPRHGVIQYPIWLNLGAANVNKDQVSVMELESLLMIEAGSLDKSPVSSTLEFTPLISTAKESGLAASSVSMQEDPSAIMKAIRPGNQALHIAAIYSDVFESAFSSKPEGSEVVGDHKARSDSRLSILVIADTDFMSDGYAVRQMNLFGQTLTTVANDNLNFVANTLEFMAGDQDLIGIRSRGKSARPFERVIAMQKDAQLRWQEKEEELNNRLQEVQTKINQLQDHKVEGGKVILSRDQLQELEKLREAESQFRKDRREVRKNLREDIEKLGRTLTFVNVFLVPILLAVYGTWRVMSYSRRGGR